MALPGNRGGFRRDHWRMGCDDCREAISAELDGEGLAGESAAVVGHLDGCAACRLFADRAAHVTRLTRTRLAEPGPELVAAVVAAAPRARRRRPAAALRLALGAVGIGQVALAVGGTVGAYAHVQHGGAELAGASMAHLANESSAWNVALAVGFLWVAIGGSRTTGLLPVVGAFVAVLTMLSVLDVVGGRVEPGRLLTHALVVIGFLLLLALRRRDRGGGGTDAARAPSGRRAVGRPARFPLRPVDDGDGLRPTARHRAA